MKISIKVDFIDLQVLYYVYKVLLELLYITLNAFMGEYDLRHVILTASKSYIYI